MCVNDTHMCAHAHTHKCMHTQLLILQFSNYWGEIYIYLPDTSDGYFHLPPKSDQNSAGSSLSAVNINCKFGILTHY